MTLGGGGLAVIWHVPLTKKLKIEEKRVQQERSGKKTLEKSYPREKEKNREKRRNKKNTDTRKINSPRQLYQAQ